MKTWNQKDAIEFCINVENYLRPKGLHVALTGGTLYKEGERKDLDLFIYKNDNFDHYFPLDSFWLQDIGLKLTNTNTESKKDYDGTGLNHFTMQKCVTNDGRNVEIFYVTKQFLK